LYSRISNKVSEIGILSSFQLRLAVQTALCA
jgi:hypothetical protein